jgi:hypothetical protein
MDESCMDCETARKELLYVHHPVIEQAISLVSELQAADQRDALVQLQKDASEVWRERLNAPKSVDAFKWWRNLDYADNALYGHLRQCLLCRRWAYLVVDCTEARVQINEVNQRNRRGSDPQSIEEVEEAPVFSDELSYLSPIVASHVSECPVCREHVERTQPNLGLTDSLADETAI